MIEIKNLTKKFGDFVAVDNLNLTIEDGKVFGLLGRNGAGKTTTIKMLTSLLTPTSGEIYYDGRNFFENLLEVKQDLAYIPDTPYVYDKLTGIEFLIFIGSLWNISKADVEKKAKPLIELFNLDEIINKKTEDFSHGSRQKLVFIASLIHNPKYLIVDEPMVGLDVQSAKLVKQLFRMLAEKGVNVILTTHQMSVAEEVCDKVAIIHNGQLKALLKTKEELASLEDKFIKITGGLDVNRLKEIL